jgi:hypothetical protein
MKIILYLILFLSLPIVSLSQGEIRKESSVLLKNETSFGLTLSTQGYGLGYRYGKHQWARTKTIYQADFFYTKHPKEIKSSSYYFPNKSYVHGKVNTLFNLHLGYGIQQELFSKEDQGGIAIRYFILGGPALAFLKPNYYEITYNIAEYVVQDFDSYFNNTTHAGIIIGDASFFKGMNEIRVTPGGFFMVGLNFDYHSSTDLYNALEAGIMIDAYLNRLPILSENLVKASPFLFQLFLTYRFGRILDGGN